MRHPFASARLPFLAFLAAVLTGQPALAAPPRTASSPLPAPVAAAIASSGLPNSSFGIYAAEVDGDRTVIRLNEEQPFTMASTTKLVTSLVALDLLGPYYRWHTSAYAMGPIVRDRLIGDLLIVGGGNAQLTSAELQAWFGRMRAQGLVEIQGDIVLDRFAFQLSAADHAHTPVQSANQPRHVWPDAMTLDEGLLTVVLQATRNGRPALRLQPALSDVRLVDRLTPGGGCEASAHWQKGSSRKDGKGAAGRPDEQAAEPRQVVDPPQAVESRQAAKPRPDAEPRQAAASDRGREPGLAEIVVQGNWSAACGTRAISFVPPADSGYAARALAQMWAAGGGVLQGKVVAPEHPLSASAVPAGDNGEPLKPLSFHRSKPLPEIIRDINKVSDNVGARNLMLSLAPGFPERAATLTGAQRTVRQWLRQHGLADGDIVVENGSGLSHSERARPRAMVQLLRQAWHGDQSQAFIDSLPIAGVDGTLANRLRGRAAGRAFLKTGTLNDTVALAGYVRGASGKMYAVAVMVNSPEAATARGAIDLVIEWLARSG